MFAENRKTLFWDLFGLGIKKKEYCCFSYLAFSFAQTLSSELVYTLGIYALLRPAWIPAMDTAQTQAEGPWNKCIYFWGGVFKYLKSTKHVCYHLY